VAGTEIEIGRAEVFHDSQVSYSDELSISVSQDYGLNLVTPEVVGPVSPGGSYYFPHILSNVGNGSDQFGFELSGTTTDWSTTLVRDDNRNGIHEGSETSPVENPVTLAEDATYYFFVVLTAPENAASDATGQTTLTSSGSVDDGGTYLGANGSYYGGPDSGLSSVLARVVWVDTTPPSISNLIINGRKRFAEDIISSRLKIEATVTDDEPRNVAKIEVWIDDSLKYQGTTADWKDAYDMESGKFEVELSQLDPGEYSFKIIAWDRIGNKAEESISPLYVSSPTDIRVVGPPLNFPNPFAPLKGEKTAIAYVLATDMDITLYIYDLVGSPVWKRNYHAFEEGGKAGYNEIVWSGRTDFGQIAGNGIYICKIVHHNKVIARLKVTVLD
jgi:hypothetical protein